VAEIIGFYCAQRSNSMSDACRLAAAGIVLLSRATRKFHKIGAHNRREEWNGIDDAPYPAADPVSSQRLREAERNAASQCQSERFSAGVQGRLCGRLRERARTDDAQREPVQIGPAIRLGLARRPGYLQAAIARSPSSTAPVDCATAPDPHD